MPSVSLRSSAHHVSLPEYPGVLIDEEMRAKMRQAFPLPAAAQGEDGHLCFLLDALKYVSAPKS